MCADQLGSHGFSVENKKKRKKGKETHKKEKKNLVDVVIKPSFGGQDKFLHRPEGVCMSVLLKPLIKLESNA